MKNKRLETRKQKITKDIDIYIEHSFDIVDRIYQILKDQNRDQKYLAKALGKSESEISKWMTGTHNFTIKTISKIEAVLGKAIIDTYREKVKPTIYINSSSIILNAPQKSNTNQLYFESKVESESARYCENCLN